MVAIVQMSDKLKKQNAEPKIRGNGPVYPWKDLEVNQSFIVDSRNLKKTSIVSLAYKTGGKLGKKFIVTVHEGPQNIGGVEYPNGVYEVGRVE